MLAKTLRYFRDRKADAVVISGDLSDWGLASGFRLLMETWNGVFPNDRAPGGRKVQRLFCTGNHDYEGCFSDEILAGMRAAGYDESDSLFTLGMKKCWEEIFQEEFDLVRRRDVNGYAFVSGEWHREGKIEGFDRTPAWLAKHGSELDSRFPFFYFQHPPVGATVVPGNGEPDPRTEALSRFPNAVVLTGHTHATLNSSTSIWQGDFTAVSVPSLSYTSTPRGYENGYEKRNGTSTRSMPMLQTRRDLEEAQGFFVSVYPEEMVFERRNFAQGEEAGEAWIVPLGADAGRPFSFESHSSRVPVPQFPRNAWLEVGFSNTDNRRGFWQVTLEFRFPNASAEPRARAFDYEVRIVRADGGDPVVKRFLSPAFHKLQRDEPSEMRFWMDAADLPKGVPYRVEVYPRNSFGVVGKPLVSEEMRPVAS